MKKIAITLLSITSLFFISCNVEDEVNKLLEDLLKFDVTLKDSFEIDASALSLVQGVEFTPQTITQKVGPIKTNISELLGDNNANSESIEEIIVKSMKLKTEEGQNFNAFQSLTIKIGDLEIGSINPIPANQSEIDITSLTKSNLKDLINKDEVTLDLEITVKEVLASNFPVEYIGVFEVNGKINL